MRIAGAKAPICIAQAIGAAEAAPLQSPGWRALRAEAARVQDAELRVMPAEAKPLQHQVRSAP
jgi:hypothetical protein